MKSARAIKVTRELKMEVKDIFSDSRPRQFIKPGSNIVNLAGDNQKHNFHSFELQLAGRSCHKIQWPRVLLVACTAS